MKKQSLMTAYIACNGGCRATAECSYGCVSCGLCVSVCPYEAIEMGADGVPVIDRERCIGCRRCVRECPREVIRVHERANPIVVRCSNLDAGKDARKQCTVSCIGCGLCEKVCPSGAAVVSQNLSRIDEKLCLSCGQCLVKCPRGVIVDERGILRK